MPRLKNRMLSILPELATGLRFSVLMLVLCGAIYSPLTTLAASVLFPWQAGGSLIQRDGKVIGSVLVGQRFTSAAYFHGRPSAAGYDPMATAGSNLAPDNPELRKRAMEDSHAIQTLESTTPGRIPADFLAASGSGVDPHISLAAAQLQIPRVARIRGIDETELAALVNDHTQGKQFGVLGQTRVNVLQLNLALDRLTATAPTGS